MSREHPAPPARRAPTPALRDSGGVSAALQLSPLPSFMVDESGTVLACNELFAERAGVPHTLLVGREWWQAFAARSADEALAAQRAIAGSIDPHGSAMFALHHADGRLAYLDVAWRRLSEPGTRRMVWIFTVTGWRRSANAGHRTAGFSQVEANAGEIAALAADEVEAAARELSSAWTRVAGTLAASTEIDHGLARLHATAQGLRRFAREHAGAPTETSAAELVRSALEALPVDLRARTVRVVDHSRAPLRIAGPSPQRILTHVLAKALRHLPPGESAHVRTYDEPGFVCIEVRDQGPGIRPEVLAAASEPVFARAEGARAAGLTTARGLARALGGSLRLGNNPEGGAVAVLTLPCGTH
jgi:PAS domain S-box-containing protein